VRSSILILLAVLPLAAQNHNTALALTVRPQCGILTSAYSQAAGSNVGILHFVYVARTGQSGGKLLIQMPPGAEATSYQTNLGGPAAALPGAGIVQTSTIIVGDIPPNGRTLRAGAEGEVRFVWSTLAPPASSPSPSVTCP
jgi:hypothetical protein